MQPARTLDQILSELGGVYQPQIDSIRQRQALIPGQVAEEEKGLGAKQEQAFGDILGGARRRGLGFSGIPLGEQAKYTATEYMPALARLRQSGREQAMSLEDAILGIQERRQTAALGQQQYEQQRYDQYQAQQAALAEQRRQAAAQTAAYSGLFNGGGKSQQPSMPAGMTPKVDQLGNFKGFNFNAGGKPVSAATFAAQNKIDIGDLLYSMGQQGDTTAARAYDWLKSIQGSEFYKNGKYKQSPAYQKTFASLFWGA